MGMGKSVCIHTILYAVQLVLVVRGYSTSQIKRTINTIWIVVVTLKIQCGYYN